MLNDMRNSKRIPRSASRSPPPPPISARPSTPPRSPSTSTSKSTPAPPRNSPSPPPDATAKSAATSKTISSSIPTAKFSKPQATPAHSAVTRIANDIPIGKGCGSSAAARLAGIALASPLRPPALDRRPNHRRSLPPRAPSRQRLRLLDGRPHRRPHVRQNAEAQVVGDHVRKGSGRCCSPFPSRRSRPKKPAASSPRNIRAPTPSPMCRIPCCCSPPSPKDAPTCSPSLSKTASTSPTAPRSARCSRVAGTQGKRKESSARPSAAPALGPDLSRPARLAHQKHARNVAAHLTRNSLTAELLPTSIALRGARNLPDYVS